MAKRRISLVWPEGFDTEYVVPLALGYLKSNLDPDLYEVQIIDCSLRKLGPDSEALKRELEDFQPELVGISSWSPTFRSALATLELAKSLLPNVTTVMGGAHASSYANHVMENSSVDFVFCGEADLSFPVFLQELFSDKPDYSIIKGLVYRGSGEKLAKNPTEKAEDLDIIKFPDYDAMGLEEYFDAGYRWNTPERRNAPIWVTRGCPYRCTFCAAPELNGRPIRTHSVEYMVEWVKYLYHEKGIRWLNIIDDNFTFNWRYASAFCEAIIDLDLKDLGFGTPNGIRLQKGDPNLWKLMKKAGWRTLNVAPESGSENVLKIMKKDLDLAIVPKVVKEIRDAGLKVQAYFIIGYPGETEEDLHETTKLIKQCKFNFVFLNNFQPLPGTPVYDQLVADGEIEDGLLPQNYSDGSRAYTPENLKDFNFAKFILKTYLMMVVRDPLNFPYMLRIFGLRLIIRKLWNNIIGMMHTGVRVEKFDNNSSQVKIGNSVS